MPKKKTEFKTDVQPAYDPDDRAEEMLNLVEAENGTDICSLRQYREMMDSLWRLVRERVSQLDSEIG